MNGRVLARYSENMWGGEVCDPSVIDLMFVLGFIVLATNRTGLISRTYN